MVATPAVPRQGTRRPLYGSLYLQVLAAIVAGGLLGYFDPALGAQLGPLGEAFVKLVKMIIAPVIFLTIVTGIGRMGDLGRVRQVAFKAFAYFLALSTVALLIGVAVGDLVRPGAGFHASAASLNVSAVATYAAKAHDQTITGFLTNIIPTTFLSALTGGDVLQVLLVAILFAVGLLLVGDRAEPVLQVLEGASAAVFKVVAILMRAAPVGAFGAFAFTIGKYGLASIAHLAMLVGSFYLTSAIFVVLGLGAVARLNGFSILKLIRYLKAELLLVLGTSSSEAALPSLMEKMERAGCAKPVVGLVVPTGYSFNLDGTNIYMTLAALFIAHATDTHLSVADQALLFAVAMLSSKGAAGVTGAGFITLAATLSVVPTVPVAGMALILGVDRFMSEGRALVNFIGNAVACVVVARWEGDLDRPALAAALNGEADAGPQA